jgi:hypothetical protein
VSEPGKITASHLSRTAVIYVRQSTLMEVERNTESTMRQYDLVSRARQLGWFARPAAHPDRLPAIGSSYRLTTVTGPSSSRWPGAPATTTSPRKTNPAAS